MKEELQGSCAVDESTPPARPLRIGASSRLDVLWCAAGRRWAAGLAEAAQPGNTQAHVVGVVDVADTMNIAPSADRLGGCSLTS